jgi:hypothetical protein
MKTAQIFIYTSIIIIVLLRVVFHTDIPCLYTLIFTLLISAIIIKIILVKKKNNFHKN